MEHIPGSVVVSLGMLTLVWGTDCNSSSCWGYVVFNGFTKTLVDSMDSYMSGSAGPQEGNGGYRIVFWWQEIGHNYMHGMTLTIQEAVAVNSQ